MLYILTNPATHHTEYPYIEAKLRFDNPNVSFPASMSDADLAAWNVYPVMQTPIPTFNSLTHRIHELAPVNRDGQWYQVWDIEPLTDPEASMAHYDAMNALRDERDARLRDSDWTQIPDAPLSTEQKVTWAKYRQALRDVPENTDNPLAPVWPVAPGGR